MRHHRLQPHAWLVPLAVAFGVASCAETTGIGSYTITYRATTTQTFKKVVALTDSIVTYATLDSITYSNGTAKCVTSCNGDSTLTKVTSPAANYSTELTVPSGSTVLAHLYGSGTATPGPIVFAVVWMTANGGIQTDSVTATTAAGTKFQLDLAKRTLSK